MGCFAFTETVTALPERCGDQVFNPSTGEQCDDGNNLAGDCCTPTCQFEPAGTDCSTSSFCGSCAGNGGGCIVSECPFVLDHYQCYDGADLKVPDFQRVSVDTNDQIGSEQVQARRLKYLCTPVDKNGESIHDPNAHLACDQATGANLSPRPHIQVSTQFQMSRFELKRSKLLCLPATKTLLP